MRRIDVENIFFIPTVIVLNAHTVVFM